MTYDLDPELDLDSIKMTQTQTLLTQLTDCFIQTAKVIGKIDVSSKLAEKFPTPHVTVRGIAILRS